MSLLYRSYAIRCQLRHREPRPFQQFQRMLERAGMFRLA